jgi:hypothetical protein
MNTMQILANEYGSGLHVQHIPINCTAEIERISTLSEDTGSTTTVPTPHKKKKGRTQCKLLPREVGSGEGPRGCFLAAFPMQCKEAGSNPGTVPTPHKGNK